MVQVMFFGSAIWLIGAVFALEGLRRGFIGGSSLSLFIIKEFGLTEQAAPTLAYLRQYLAIEESILASIPKELKVFLSPWIDHHDAGVTYLKIIDLLAEAERPKDCEFYWQKDE